MPKVSPIWKYFQASDIENKKAICNLCLNTLSYKSTITNLKLHLKKKHLGEFEEFCRSETTTNTTSEPVRRKKWNLIRDSHNRYRLKRKWPSAAPTSSKRELLRRLGLLQDEQEDSPEREGEGKTAAPARPSAHLKSEFSYDADPDEALSETDDPLCADTNTHSAIVIPVNTFPKDSQAQDPACSKKKQETDQILQRLDAAMSSVDDVATFCKYMETTLRKLSERSRVQAKSEIFSVLSRHEMLDVERAEPAPPTEP